MSVLKKISGKECLKILCNKLGFEIIRQKRSHVILKKITVNGKVSTVVPMHKEIKIGTLKNVLKLGKISEEEFSKFL